jgi:hydroxymethylpyrimidine/phosphomethylpyrimidine kinase
LSAAIATGLAQGLSLENAVARAKNYITRAIEKSYRWPETSALNHSA